MATAIPHLFHRIWLGDQPMPEEYVQFGRTWLDHHPGWELITWTEENLPQLRNQSSFDAAPTLAMKADIARYEVVHQHGGIYIDSDFECLRNLETLLDEVDFFSAWEDRLRIAIGIFGATEQHRFLDAVIGELPGSFSQQLNGAVPDLTGPGLFTRVVAAPADADPRSRLFPPRLFYPYHWSERERRYESFPDAYAAHHWTGSWRKGHSYRVVVAAEKVGSAQATVMVREFASLFTTEDPIELVITVAHEPTETDLQEAGRMLTELQIDAGRTAPLLLESFAETVTKPFDAAVVADGSFATAMRETAELVRWMHRLRPAIDHNRATRFRHDAPAIVEAGPLGRPLQERLRRFRPVEAQQQPIAAAAPAHHATYVGDDRLLITTKWGGRLYAQASDMSITPELVQHGLYEQAFTNFLLRVVKPGNVVIDVGANIGVFTVLMARLVGARGRVMAYEPSPINFALLRDNVALNYQARWVTPIAKAAGAETGALRFHESTRFHGNGSLVAHDEAYRERFLVDEHAEIEVEVEPLDVHRAELPRIDLVKIDVEGGEELVFRGMSELIRTGAVDRICFECLRSRMAEDWAPFAERLQRMVSEGWTSWLLGDDGTERRTDIGEIVAVAEYGSVILRSPGMRI